MIKASLSHSVHRWDKSGPVKTGPIRVVDTPLLLHKPCSGSNVSLVRTLIQDHKADINARDDQITQHSTGGKERLHCF